MPCKHIYGTAFPANRERHLGRHLPANSCQIRECVFDEVGVLGIQQPIEGFAVPVDLDAQAGTERLQNAFDRSNWHAIALAAFDAADGRLRGPGGSGEISLTPTAPSTQTSNGASNPHEIHRRSLENLHAPAIGSPPTP